MLINSCLFVAGASSQPALVPEEEESQPPRRSKFAINFNLKRIGMSSLCSLIPFTPA